jgi:hypothetical protein
MIPPPQALSGGGELDNAVGGEGPEQEREKRENNKYEVQEEREAAPVPLVRLKAALQRGQGSKLLISASEKAWL